MKRGASASGLCGIAMQPSYPVAGSGPSPPSPSSTHYEDPNNGGCRSDEEAVQIEGIAGSFCSPKCENLIVVKECTKDVPPGTTAKPECVLETSGSSTPTQCALICNPADESDGCPQNASCTAISGTGICTYD